MITKFTDSDNNICYTQYVETKDCFIVWTEELPNVKHTLDCEEVEELFSRGIWKRLQ